MMIKSAGWVGRGEVAGGDVINRDEGCLTFRESETISCCIPSKTLGCL